MHTINAERDLAAVAHGGGRKHVGSICFCLFLTLSRLPSGCLSHLYRLLQPPWRAAGCQRGAWTLVVVFRGLRRPERAFLGVALGTNEELERASERMLDSSDPLRCCGAEPAPPDVSMELQVEEAGVLQKDLPQLWE